MIPLASRVRPGVRSVPPRGSRIGLPGALTVVAPFVLLGGAPSSNASAVPAPPRPGTGAFEATSDTLPEPVEDSVPEAETAHENLRTLAAKRWGVPTESVRVEWGRPRGLWPPVDPTPVELLGPSDDGFAVITFGSDPERRTIIRARLSHAVRAPVAARALSRGAILGPDDIRWEKRIRHGPPRPGTAPGPEPGWSVRRAMASGEELRVPRVAPPLAVEAGEEVELRWAQGNVVLTLTARALASAAVGEAVRLRLSGRKTLSGVVAGPGRVDLGEPLRASRQEDR